MRILLLDTNESQREQSAAVLEKTAVVTRAANWRQACLLLGQQLHNLALLSATDASADLVRALRLIQADLRVMLLMPDGREPTMPANANIQGVLRLDNLETEAARELPRVSRQRVLPVAVPRLATPPLTIRQMRDLLTQSVTDETVESALIALDTGLVVSRGALSERLGAAVAVIVRHSWRDPDFPVQVQFLHLPALTGDHLIYAQRVRSDILVALVAKPSASTGVLQEQAERVARGLRAAAPGTGSPRPSIIEPDVAEEAATSRTYAIAWKPVEPLPGVLHIPLRRVLERLANAGNSQLHYLTISDTLVHLVVTPPPGCNSIWLAQHFKNGSELEIRTQFNVQATLWARGYFARETTTPLSGAELNLFLEHNYA